MAKAGLRPDPDALFVHGPPGVGPPLLTADDAARLRRIRALCAELDALPAAEQPREIAGRRAGSPAYQAIADRIYQETRPLWI